MNGHRHTLEFQTRKPQELVDLTSAVQEWIRSTNAQEGTLSLFCPHTTAGLLINENSDPAVRQDLLDQLERMIPVRGPYRHGEGNSAAHIKSALIGTTLTVFLHEGRLELGTWQGIFFAEFDGPRARQIWLRIEAEDASKSTSGG
jgi:secondary thiamine-phosphate synthase enzyme